MGPSLKKSGKDLWTLVSLPGRLPSRVVAFTLGLDSAKGSGKSNGNSAQKITYPYELCRNIM